MNCHRTLTLETEIRLLNDLIFLDLRSRSRTDDAAVLQNVDLIREPQALVHVLLDQHHRLSASRYCTQN